MHALHKEAPKIHKQESSKTKLSVFVIHQIGFYQQLWIVKLKITKIKIFLKVLIILKYITKPSINFLNNSFLKQDMLIFKICKNQILQQKGN